MPAEAEQQQPLGPDEALQQLAAMLADEGSWAQAPATASAELAQQWEAAFDGGGGARGGAAAAAPSTEDPLRLMPRFGSQAAGVAALCECAGTAGTKWVVQQQRTLGWLQQRRAQQGELCWVGGWHAVRATTVPAGRAAMLRPRQRHSTCTTTCSSARATHHACPPADPDQPPLWHIPVPPAPAPLPAPLPAPPPAGAAAHGGAPLQGQADLQAAFQDLLEHAADIGDEGAAGALQAIAAGVLAAGMGEGAEEAAEGEEEGSSEGEFDVDVPPELAAVFGQLGEGAEEAAEAAAVAAAAEQHQGVGVGGVAVAQGVPAGAGGDAVQQHTSRLWVARAPGSCLWSLLGSGVVQWEAAHRDTAGGWPPLGVEGTSASSQPCMLTRACTEMRRHPCLASGC